MTVLLHGIPVAIIAAATAIALKLRRDNQRMTRQLRAMRERNDRLERASAARIQAVELQARGVPRVGFAQNVQDLEQQFHRARRALAGYYTLEEAERIFQNLKAIGLAMDGKAAAVAADRWLRQQRESSQ